MFIPCISVLTREKKTKLPELIEQCGEHAVNVGYSAIAATGRSEQAMRTLTGWT